MSITLLKPDESPTFKIRGLFLQVFNLRRYLVKNQNLLIETSASS